MRSETSWDLSDGPRYGGFAPIPAGWSRTTAASHATWSCRRSMTRVERAPASATSPSPLRSGTGSQPTGVIRRSRWLAGPPAGQRCRHPGGGGYRALMRRPHDLRRAPTTRRAREGRENDLGYVSLRGPDPCKAGSILALSSAPRSPIRIRRLRSRARGRILWRLGVRLSLAQSGPAFDCAKLFVARRSQHTFSTE